MVFSDPIFIAAFLPASLVIFHLLRAYVGGTVAVASLVALSMVFYAYWSVPYLLLLLAQIAANYLFGLQLEKTRDRNILIVAVVCNLSLLGYFKYRNFFLTNVGDLVGLQFHLTSLIVPLGISFHTFQQIALLVDIRNQGAKLPPLLNYVMFVLFFPQLIAGPIVLHQEMGKQVFALRAGKGPGLQWLSTGVLIFVFGLFKKVCLADNIAHYADVAFIPGLTLTMAEAWVGVGAYALQLFFDFSGYSDMAVGMGLMFGLKLPNNFLIPYAAKSLAQFWQQWHITMIRFFTMYLYNPMWLRFRRRLRRSRYFQEHPSAVLEVAFTISLPTLVTFLLSGLWHGAGWTFICFGLVHGVGMVIAQTWNAVRLPSPPQLVGWLLTMIVVLIGAMYFRANDLTQAHYILHQMFMAWGPLSVPGWMASALPFHVPVGTFTLFAELKDTTYCLAWTALLACLSVLLPPLAANPEALKLTPAKAIATAGMAWLIVGFIGEPRTFLYFAF